MSEFLLVRDTFVKGTKDIEGFTLGTLCCDGHAIGMTCEDEDRHLEGHPDDKIYGRTAIPRGRYRITVSESKRFGKVLPILLDVPGFQGIRIHAGNTAADSSGCILVGSRRTASGVANCAGVVQRIIDLIRAAEQRKEQCWIKVM